MHPLHDYVAAQLGERLRSRKVVVWYDARREFAPFVEELRGGPCAGSELVPVTVVGSPAQLAEYSGSMLELRAVVEPLVCGDGPEPVVIYLPGCERDRHSSLLMELEKGGDCYETQLKRLARNVLRRRYTDGTIDEMLAPEGVTYEDLARAAGTTGDQPPSILKGIFHEARGSEGLLAAWLVSDAKDGEIAAKEADRELVKLIRSHLGLELPEETPLPKLRAVTLRYVLAGEFRSDLGCQPPPALEGVPKPRNKEEESALRNLAHGLRASFPELYAELADRVEGELGLKSAAVPPSGLGAIDTFRFEERALLAYCGELVAEGKHDEAVRIIGLRERSYWLDRDVARKAQWEACRRMAELGAAATAVRAAVAKTEADARAWMDAYVAPDGWHRLDRAQRSLESWVVKLEEDPDERPLVLVRRAYDDACHAMAEGFAKALVKAKWSVVGPLSQTGIFKELVDGSTTPVAYFLVDALRYEMGAELQEKLPKTSEVTVRHAVGALPSITPVGMAALQPGASGSFAVVEQDGELGVRIDDAFLPGAQARKKYAAARIPALVDMGLDELLSFSPQKLASRVEKAKVVVVRSQEIDQAGEAGFAFQARQAMDTVIDNLARAIRKLAAAGVSTAVVTADHGHLFFGTERDESMRIDSPGGETVELHRRCWIGRGGATPPGCVRVSAAGLGYASDLEFVFPAGAGVFRAGGDLAFVHGGPSLQEMVIPVVSVRTKVEEPAKGKSKPLSVTGLPARVTNRIFTATIQPAEQNLGLFATLTVVRPFLVAAGRQVGAVGMAIDAQLDQATGCVTLQPGKSATVAFQLSDDSVKSVRMVVLDPATDAELYRSPEDIAVQLGV